MLRQQSFTQPWNLSLGRKTQASYIPGDEVNPANLSRAKEEAVKTSILWLLSKATHSVEEIADHFAITPQLAGHFVAELEEIGSLKKIQGRPIRYQVINQKAGEVYG